MTTFKDSAGREWKIDLTFGAIERVRAGADIDLLDLSDENVFIQVAESPRKLMHVLYSLLEAQLASAEMTPEQFAEVMSGPHIAEATRAFTTEWLDFFQNPAQRRVMTTALAKVDEYRERVKDFALKEMAPGGAMDQMIERVMIETAATLRASAHSSGAPQASSASTPEGSPGAS